MLARNRSPRGPCIVIKNRVRIFCFKLDCAASFSFLDLAPSARALFINCVIFAPLFLSVSHLWTRARARVYQQREAAVAHRSRWFWRNQLRCWVADIRTFFSWAILYVDALMRRGFIRFLSLGCSKNLLSFLCQMHCKSCLCFSKAIRVNCVQIFLFTHIGTLIRVL